VQVKGPEGDPIIEKRPRSSISTKGRCGADESVQRVGIGDSRGRTAGLRPRADCWDASTHGKGTVQSLLQWRR